MKEREGNIFMLFPSYESMRKDEEMGTTNGFHS